MLKCPLCDFSAKDLVGLKEHFRTHKLNSCPICGAEVRRFVQHCCLKAKHDEEHAVYYALAKSPRNVRNNRKFLQYCRDLAENRLTV